jgi:hypothetical protein
MSGVVEDEGGGGDAGGRFYLGDDARALVQAHTVLIRGLPADVPTEVCGVCPSTLCHERSHSGVFTLGIGTRRPRKTHPQTCAC